MALVVDFGAASREPVFRAFRRLVSTSSSKLFVLSAQNEVSLEYAEFDRKIDDALDELAQGRVSSIQTEGRSGTLLSIFCPSFLGGGLRDWSGSAEGSETVARRVFDELLEMDELGFLSLSEDESPDLDTAHVTVQTFPWEDWKLINAAVRDPKGRWIRLHRSTAENPK